jgi:hypothetical protein
MNVEHQIRTLALARAHTSDLLSMLRRFVSPAVRVVPAAPASAVGARFVGAARSQ